jgi:hypothetical protein
MTAQSLVLKIYYTPFTCPPNRPNVLGFINVLFSGQGAEVETPNSWSGSVGIHHYYYNQ